MSVRWSDYHPDTHRPAIDPGALILGVVLVVLMCAWVALKGGGEVAPADTLPPAVYVVDQPATAGATAERQP